MNHNFKLKICKENGICENFYGRTLKDGIVLGLGSYDESRGEFTSYSYLGVEMAGKEVLEWIYNAE